MTSYKCFLLRDVIVASKRFIKTPTKTMIHISKTAVQHGKLMLVCMLQFIRLYIVQSTRCYYNVEIMSKLN